MRSKLSPTTIALLTVPPLMWSGNAIVGRLIYQDIPPMSLNFLRWLCAFFLLLPIAYPIFRRDSSVWREARHYALLSLFGIGLYNALQYLALQSSGPINVTLVASGIPIWMLLIGALFFNAPIRQQQVFGAILSIIGVLIVLSRGSVKQLMALHLVIGDILMLAASIAWAFYSWMLSNQQRFADVRHQWAKFLLAQITFGLIWSAGFSAAEWHYTDFHIHWSWQLAFAILFVAIGPAIIAFRCWGTGVQKAGADVAGFFVNLTPLFTALLSTIILGEQPHWYHFAAFICIVAGIIVSSGKTVAKTRTKAENL
ncbi:DMT family transporter [Undibacterium fentianense]|uniref:DMT family transporter n=1 Tax=Undibacterium fentianense TaxID=2828728 RepID=A0A941E593_9BURK|nr:DMT family transporter [Undibacterium fentianense]MBR7801312.1 DMT family transporter [Undibacterium fentianense]